MKSVSGIKEMKGVNGAPTFIFNYVILPSVLLEILQNIGYLRYKYSMPKNPFQRFVRRVAIAALQYNQEVLVLKLFENQKSLLELLQEENYETKEGVSSAPSKEVLEILRKSA